MIRFTLKCGNDHGFESWFKSAEAFDTLRRAGMINCSVCGDGEITKAPMAPRIMSGGRGETPQTDTATPLSGPPSAAEQALRDLREKIETSADYVGRDFAKQARAIHQGDAPERAIYGETRADEARALLEEGVPVMPLPFAPGRKTN